MVKVCAALQSPRAWAAPGSRPIDQEKRNGAHGSVAQDLDFLLYAWLSEPDERRAELLFTRYFRAAFPRVCRFVHSLGADAAMAQDISQQALIKLFVAVGTGRRSAEGRLREALLDLKPLDLGTLHRRLVQAWREQVGRFADAAARFCISPSEPPGEQASWEATRDEINGRTEPLRRQGMHLLRDVRERLAPALQTLIVAEPPVTPDREGRPEEAGQDSPDEETLRHVTLLLQYAVGRDRSQVDAALGCTGAVGFFTHTRTVFESLPSLAVPSNGLLYTIAKRQLLDGLRSRWSSRVPLTPAVEDEAAGGILDEWALEDGSPGEHPLAQDSFASEPADLDDSGSVESRYRAFLELLRAPLTRAEHALAAAASEGKGRIEHGRVESLRRKYERLVAVLSALHESPQPSEEEIARRLGLSRNQVKYVIERVREEFNHFFPDLTGEARGRRKRQGAEL